MFKTAAGRGQDFPMMRNLDSLHFHLIFGLKSFSYFLYCQPDDKPGVEGVFEGMITYNGEKRMFITGFKNRTRI